MTVPFDAFICYKRLSAEDFAETLKKSLEEFGVHTFLDIQDIPTKFKGTAEWEKARDAAVVGCRIFVLILTAGFELSSEIKKELTLARKCGNKEFVYFRHKSLKPNLKIALNGEELDIGKQQQVSFGTENDLVRKAHSIIVEGQDIGAVVQRSEKKALKEITDSISNFAAFYDTVRGIKKVQKVYPKLFTTEEMQSPGKAEKICRILETYMGDRGQFKQALQTIINLHRDYSLKNVDGLRDILNQLGFSIDDHLYVIDDKKAIQESVTDIIKRYHEAVLDAGNPNDPLPYKLCPECGSADLERSSVTDYEHDETYFSISCRKCGWGTWSQ
jgi:hypothetical protein